MFRIVHFSDLHAAAPMRTFSGFFDKRIVGAANSRFARRKIHNQCFADLAVKRILEDPPDVIVFSGDAASCGQPSEFNLAYQALKPLADSGIPLIYTPGNHDLYVRNRLCRAACREFTEKITNGLMRLDGYPYAFTLGPLRFLVFNGARPTNPVLSCGFLGEADRTMIREECARKQLPIVAVCHFPFRRIRRGLVNGMRHRLFGAKEAARALSEEKIDLALCGHIHVPFFDLDGNGRGETSCGSLTRYGAYSVIEFTGSAFVHRRVNLELPQ